MNANYSAKQKELALARPDGVAHKATKTYTSVHARLRRFLNRRKPDRGPSETHRSPYTAFEEGYAVALADVRAWLDRDRDS